MNTKLKLSSDSTHIMEDSNDEQIMFNHMEDKKPRKSEGLKKDDLNEFKETPIRTGKKYERPQTPDIKESSAPTLHSNMYKYKGPSQKEEVMLAVMDAHLNELHEDEEALPDLRKKWVESAVDILMGAPPQLPPLREINHQIPLIDENKQYNYHLP